MSAESAEQFTFEESYQGMGAISREAISRSGELDSANAVAGEAKWAETARMVAHRTVSEAGFPRRRDEYWKFTNPNRLVAEVPAPAKVAAPETQSLFEDIDCLKIFFVDGLLDLKRSDDLALSNAVIDFLDSAVRRDNHWGSELFGRLEAQSQSPISRPFAADNTARAQSGLFIRATGQVPRPIAIYYLRSAPDADAIIRHVVQVEPGAEITVLESGPGAARMNKVIEVEIGDGGTVHHIQVQGREHERSCITHLMAELGQGSHFRSFALTANGALTRNESVVGLSGDGGSAHLSGVAVGDGNFHHDDTIFVTHGAEACESRQVFKKVLRNNAVGVFQGKILVKPGAQKTDGYQISQGLLLDEKSQFFAKPELEIYADDVVCSHGSTCGSIDEDAMLYLRSRGIDKTTAEDMLALAFLSEALDEIHDRRIATKLNKLLAGWLERHH